MSQRGIPVCVLLMLLLSRWCFALPPSYPVKAVRVVVPAATGGATDVVARLMCSALTHSMGYPFVVDNRAGAGGMLGTDIVAKSAPDGHSLLFAYAGHTVLPFLYKKVPYDVKRDFIPITLVASQALLLVTTPQWKVNRVDELVGLLKARPGQWNAALPTTTGAAALAMEMFRLATHTQFTSVAFKGGAPALAALLSGDVQLLFTTPPVAIPFLRSEKLTVLATSSAKRLNYLPEVPTLIESGLVDFEVEPWQGILAPTGTPNRIIETIQFEVHALLQLSAIRDRLKGMGSDPVGSSSAEFNRKIKIELEQNQKLIHLLGLTLD